MENENQMVDMYDMVCIILFVRSIEERIGD